VQSQRSSKTAIRSEAVTQATYVESKWALMVDPKKTAAARASARSPRWVRRLGAALAVVGWAIASDARPLLALFSLLAAVAIRTVYVIMTRAGRGLSVFWSAWFFAIAALCELAWLALRG
jgi:hypothetical protein